MERKNLVVVVKKLNETELTDPIDIKVKEDELRELFGQAVDSVLDNEEYGATEEERQQKLPEEVRSAYKELFLESEGELEINDSKDDTPNDKKEKTKGEKEMKKEEKKTNGKGVEKEKTKKDKPAAIKTKKEEKGPSRKLTVYKEWKKSKGKISIEELLKINEAKELSPNTIKSWIGSWAKEKNLPAGI